MNGYALSVLLVCFTISMSANAIGNENGGMRMSQMPVFSDFDTNQDKLISEEEFELLKNSSRSDEMFERIDSDHNKFIDAKEFQSHRETMRNSK
jgi:hypothetical protein